VLHISSSILHDQVQRPPPLPSTTVTGLNLAHAKRTAVERALLAADLHTGLIHLVNPTVLQSAALAGVSQPYVAMALRAAPDQRRMIEQGRLCLSEVRPRRSASAPIAWWQNADETERINFVRAVGAEAIFRTIELVV
jgi:hypothetical protein